MKYGVVIGRFQPVHMGHQAIINEVLLDGLIPIIILGSDLSQNHEKNPLTTTQRMLLWRTIYPDTLIHFIPSEDSSNEDWYEDINAQVSTISGGNHTLYYHNKLKDKTNFRFEGKMYYNTYHTGIFKAKGWATKQIEFVNRTDIHIKANARDIRKDLEAFKHLLDGRVYHKLKEMGWH